jgi:DNA processing protein
VETVGDLEYLMGWQKDGKSTDAVQKDLFVELTSEEQALTGLLQKESSLTIDQISLHGNMPVSKVSGILLNLEFKGMVKCLPGKVYQLV